MAAMDIRLYTAGQTAELDRTAIEDHEIPAYTLMTRAGEASFSALRARWPEARGLLVVCGAGNNAGDGYVIARLAREAELSVDLRYLVEPDRLSGAAAEAVSAFREAGGTAGQWNDAPSQADVAVDAILGTGLDRPLEGRFAEAVRFLNAHPGGRLAVDIPTGIQADTGAVMGVAVNADLTVTFIGRKRGLYTADGVEHVGRVVFADLGVPEKVYAAVGSDTRLIGQSFLHRRLSGRRHRNAHKGHFGAVAVLGGQPGMPGAIMLAGEAALRAGAGLVKAATHPDHAASIPFGCAALMADAVDDPPAVGRVLEWADVIALGPGLGQGRWSRMVFDTAMDTDLPMVLDADGLNLLARSPIQRGNWVLTPHPGEAARLLDVSISDIQSDRFAAAREIAGRYAASCVLKGAGTLIGDAGGFAVCATGNPGMASAGMGDVLTGVIAAMLGQGFEPTTAAELGVCIHGYAGDVAARDGERGLIAPDVIACLRQAVNVG